MSNVLLVSYNAIAGIPLGRHKVGPVIVYSGDYGRDNYMTLFPAPILNDQKIAAERTVHQLRKDIENDVLNIDEAYVYVGAAAMEGAMCLIHSLQESGKKVHIIACKCRGNAKIKFAQSLGIFDVIWSECGGDKTCAMLVEKLSTVTAA